MNNSVLPALKMSEDEVFPSAIQILAGRPQTGPKEKVYLVFSQRERNPMEAQESNSVVSINIHSANWAKGDLPTKRNVEDTKDPMMVGLEGGDKSVCIENNDSSRYNEDLKNGQRLDITQKEVVTIFKDSLPENLKQFPVSKCNRCKKDFAQLEAKSFKMCEQCRVSQRQRSRRWQRRTKQKDGVCTRCAAVLPLDSNNKYVLCQHCREMLRMRKANRYLEGKCVHCSGPNDEEGIYKVCRRCRERDRLRRLKLENNGFCNRCSSKLTPDQKGYKICSACRMKKKLYSDGLLVDDLTDSKVIRSMEIGDLFNANGKMKQTKRQKTISNTIKPKLDSELQFGATSSKENVAEDGLEPKSLKAHGQRNQTGEMGNSIGHDESGKTQYLEDGTLAAEIEHISQSALNKKGREVHNHTHNNNHNHHHHSHDHPHDDKHSNALDDIVDAETDVERLTHEISSYNENILLSEAFHLHSHNTEHDHSQLNQQLKRLSQFTSHNGTADNTDRNNHNDGNTSVDDVDVGKFDTADSVLVDLDGLDDIGMDYEIASEVNNGHHNRTNGDDDDDDEEDDEEEKEALLRHVRAVQAGLTLNSTEPTDAEIAAAVEAVAAAAASVSNNHDSKDNN